MKKPLLTLACTLLAGASAAAPPRSTFRYTPPADEERPVIADATIGPQGSDFAMRLRFDKEPWGEACKNRCANATLYLDTDSNTTTGMQLGKGDPKTGADMAVIVQGAREYKGTSPDTFLRVKVRLLTNDAKNVDEGEALADLDHRQDPERVQLDEKTVYLLVDATAPALPSARKVRVLYHPPAAKPVQGSIAGMLGGGSSGNVRIFRGGGSKKGWGKAKEAGTPMRGDNG
ncbi:hypothetical protein [Hyalangium rubrum]|uniref:Lipoprotein n=1 Tax=Hyalangium rubrum TaxID=3103134 RepID=A0ABU5GX86_9BACT|nr:hypothetical protein [Hyalangium sp. s54d21]MDY7225487.1 hypothetical protein [Hyalangium sp. s54d21]